MKSPFLVYRMVHINNLATILKLGKVVCPNHSNADPSYMQIGNNDIIEKRSQKTIPSFGTLTFRDSIAFYFGTPSIMLYNIKTGFNVPQLPQSEIIYLSYDISALTEHGYSFFYTDGQANKIPTTRIFDDLKDLGEVDLKIAFTRNFSQEYTSRDPDLIRKKHAEFHILNEIDVNHLFELVVFSDSQLKIVNGLIKTYGFSLTARVDKNYYY